eukprot:9007964-Heterocapsa_arctica.AAC.1
MDIPNMVNDLEMELRYHDMQMTHKQRGQHPMNFQPIADYEVLTTTIQTSTTERLRITPFIWRNMVLHNLREHNYAMMEDDTPVTVQVVEEDMPMNVYGEMRGEPIPIRPRIISSGSEEDLTRVVRPRLV